MKKIFTLIVVCLTTVSTWAYDVEVDGIGYNLDKVAKTAEVTSGTGYSGSVAIPETIVSNDVTYSVTSIGLSAFYGCSGLTSVSIPNSVTYIGVYAFYGCTGLTSINIPNFVTGIAQSAFEGCSGLTSITIPNSVTKIGDMAFKFCSGLTSMKLGNSLVYIGSDAFNGCTGLTAVTIPNSVTTIGNSAFGSCTGLTAVTIPNSVTTIEGWSFAGCSGLTSVTIPNSVSIIDFGTFSGCSSLTSITIPNSVTNIKGYAFDGCKSLTSITIPNSVTRIGDVAFENCSALKSVIIPNSVTSIGEGAFQGCTGLTSVTIGTEVTSFEQYAFYGCSSLKYVTCYAVNVPTLGSSVFSYYGSPVSSATLKVPAASLDLYKAADQWKDFGTITSIEGADTKIGAKLLSYKGFDGYLVNRLEMKGVTADGSAQLMLEIPDMAQKLSLDKDLYLEVWDMDGQQKLEATENETGTIELTTDVKSSGQIYVYTAPKDFCRKVMDKYYQVRIYGYDKSQKEQLLATDQIHRPGLLLIHGLNSAGDKCFPSFANYLSNTYYQNNWKLVDYESTHAATFEYNTKTAQVVKNAARKMYTDLVSQDILSSSYDLVGHSMGGILSRLYVQEDDETNESKKAKNHVHKIITVNTPHWGSNWGQVVDLVEGAIENKVIDKYGPLGQLLVYVKDKIGETKWHAINDLSPTSDAIKNLGDFDKIQKLIHIPCHSVCSYIVPTSLEEEHNEFTSYGYSDVRSFSDCLVISWGKFLQTQEAIADWSFTGFVNLALGEDRNDGVVALHSQMGRENEESKYVTIECAPYEGAFLFKSDAFHCNTTDWDKTQNCLLNLLTISVDDSRFSKSGFEPRQALAKAPKRVEEADGYEIPTLKPATSDSTYIKLNATRSVENDSVFVYLNVEHSADITKNFIMADLNEESGFMSTGRDSYRFLVPSTYSGKLVFYGIGRTDDYEAVADTVHISMEAIASIVSLEFDDEDITMVPGQTSMHFVKAIWDNQQETIVDPELSSTDEQVACIEDGLVKAVGAGTCQLIAKYGDYECRVNVEVSDMYETIPEGIENVYADDNTLRLYNVGNVLHIENDNSDGAIYNVSLYDITGTERGSYCVASDSNTATVNLNVAKNHIYIVKVVSGKHQKIYRFFY